MELVFVWILKFQEAVSFIFQELELICKKSQITDQW